MEAALTENPMIVAHLAAEYPPIETDPVSGELIAKGEPAGDDQGTGPSNGEVVADLVIGGLIGLLEMHPAISVETDKKDHLKGVAGPLLDKHFDIFPDEIKDLIIDCSAEIKFGAALFGIASGCYRQVKDYNREKREAAAAEAEKQSVPQADAVLQSEVLH